MKITRYKKLFVLSAVYQRKRNNNSVEETSDGVALYPSFITNKDFLGHRLKPKILGNLIEVYFEGTEFPQAAPSISKPLIELNTNKYYYFILQFSGKEKLNRLKFHSTPSLAKENGFPVLYDAQIKGAGQQPTITLCDNIKIVPPIFTFTVSKSAYADNTTHGILKITDEADKIIDLGIMPVMLNNKAADGINAVPEYSFSIDASSLQPGIYNFTAGSVSKKYFIASEIETGGVVSLIRILKNNFLEYKTSLADNSFAKFELKIPLA